MMKHRKLGKLADIAIGDSRGFQVLSTTIDDVFVIRTGQRSIVAYRNSCPHKGYESASMAWKKNAFLNGDKSFIRCGSHGALFRIEDGLCIQGPCSSARLTAQNVVVDKDGWLVWQSSMQTET